MFSLLRRRWLSWAVWGLLMTMSIVMILHGCLLRSWGIGTFPSIDRFILEFGEMGGFDDTPLRDADGRPSIMRYAVSPVGRFLHIFPATLWSIIAPLQVSPTFRAKHRTVHRRLGRVFIGMSVCMALGLPPLIFSRATKAHYGVTHAVAILSTCAYFLWTALVALHHARNKRVARHRVWVLRHVAMGYSVHLQRVLGILSFGFVSAVLPGYKDHTQAGADLRSVVFMTYFWVAVALSVGSMEVWLRHTRKGRE